MSVQVDMSNYKPVSAFKPRAKITGHWWKVRLIPLVVLLLSGGLLSVAAYLTPNADGHGTHKDLGLPSCGFLATTSLPCVSCGYTTSFSMAADGDIWGSMLNQPAGAILALLTATAAMISAYALVVGLSLVPLARWAFQPCFVIGLVVFMIVAWMYKIMIMNGAG
jgi:hypothetical protein